MARKVRPLEDRLLVEPVEQEAQTSSGIILPETAKERPQEGHILAAGPGRLTEGGQRLPMEVGILGWKFTLIRLGSTFILPVIGGLIAQALFASTDFG